MLLLLLLFPALAGSADLTLLPKAAGPAPASLDTNFNKIFDDLENMMAPASAADSFPVIAVFNNPLDSWNLAGLQQNIGHFLTKYQYQSIPAIAATLTRQQVELLSKLPIVKQIQYDAPMKATMDTASYWFGATKARTDFSLTGDANGAARSYGPGDIVIAVIDTGIDATHVDLDGGKVIGWKDFVNGKATPYDDNGHGTHVASIAAGEGDGNPAYTGVAPGAALVGVKVLDRRGSGLMSDVDAGIDWVIQNKATYGVEIISMSLGASGSSDGTDSTSLMVNKAVDSGITVVVAAGNEGPATYTIGSPGAAEKAITVGAQGDPGHNGFFQAYFSSRGPTADGRIKPDISAPGRYVMAAEAGSGSGYIEYSGTSMATPFVSGTAALMLAANPALTPLDVKNLLTGSSWDWGPAGKDIDYGQGRLDSYEAVKVAGKFTGTGAATPAHYYIANSLPGTGYYDSYSFNVTTLDPIAATLIIPEWKALFPKGSTPDFDVYLYDPTGAQAASAAGTQRQETIGFKPTRTGTYTLKVSSYTGAGNYFFDLSAGATSPALTLNDTK